VSAAGIVDVEKEMRMNTDRPLPRALAGELLGTYLLVLCGTGAVAAAVLTGAQVGLWPVAKVSGRELGPARDEIREPMPLIISAPAVVVSCHRRLSPPGSHVLGIGSWLWCG